jgi:hypothetical protein
MTMPWRAMWLTRQGIGDIFRLSPVAFNPDVTVAMMVPVARDPAGMRVGRFDVVAGDPDVLVAVPAVIALVPGPTGVLMGWRGNHFNGVRWGRADADYYLGIGDACRRKEEVGCSGEEFVHGFNLLYLLPR